jgi:hypothetical protein
MQDDQSRPLLPEELADRDQARPALSDPPRVPLDTGVTLAVAGTPQAEVAAVEGVPDQARVAVQGAVVGVRAFPPPIPAVEFTQEERAVADQRSVSGTDGFLPDHLALRTTPEPLPEELQVPRRIEAANIKIEDLPPGVHMATTVFGADDRVVFSDTAYPWSTIGRVETPGGVASGAMVGPRHMLTCSHTIQWNTDGTTGWVKFTPSYFDGSAPFGVAWGIQVYWEGIQVMGPTIDPEEGRHDYVVVVLDQRIGDLTGWMGSRTWSDSWDGDAFWSHVGYPGDVANTQRPTYQTGIAGTSTDSPDHTRITHLGDVWPGQSGGPFFGWWDGDTGPRVVADQSGETTAENSASGGGHMVDRITRALNEFP